MGARKKFPTYIVDRNYNVTCSGSTGSNFVEKLPMEVDGLTQVWAQFFPG
jgi:hypothetical protein